MMRDWGCRTKAEKTFFYIFRARGNDRVVWQVRMCLLQQQDMFAWMCECSWYIHIHKNAQPFFISLTRPRTTYMSENEEEKKRWNVIFIYESFLPPTHTHDVGKLTQRDQHEWTKEKETQIHKSFPPHSINVWMYMLLFLCSCCYFVLLLCVLCFLEERKQQQQQKRKKIKHTKIIKEIYRARLLFFSFLAARQMRMWKNICVYIACLLYIAFSISVLPVLCFFFGERKRISKTRQSHFSSQNVRFDCAWCSRLF